ncbi:protein GAST1-like [Momordica charantia]|uniref:Protein GAST1-like n=1 Tax=Momordica charantia TaxID=3673 RepID=A0A6J1DFN7_MOMCH|nr:protein GAST1-like [Momordica charantia]
MASISSLLLLSLPLMFLFFTHNQAASSTEAAATSSELYGTTEGTLQPQECGGRCTARCSATAFKKPCMFFCKKCCATCLCVPPGTYGNKQMCPCYNNWKTKRGGPKCP